MPAKLDRCVASAMADLRKRYPSEDEAKLKSRAFAICNASLKGGEMRYAYLSDLSGLTFDDAGKAPPIHALTTGTWNHPMYGEVKITPERVKRFAENVNNKVRGQDLDIDYDHKARDGRAAGWIIAAENRDGDLYLNIDWTTAAKEAIKNKEYRYFSPELSDEWEDPRTSKKYQDVLAGGALTNRPFFKQLAALNFAEFNDYDDDPVTILMNTLGWTQDEASKLYTFSDNATATWPWRNTPPPVNDPKEAKLDPKKLAEILGLKDEEDEAKLLSEVKNLKTFHDDKASEEEKAKKFAETYPEEAKQLTELREINAKTYADTTIKSLNEKGIPPVVNDKLKEAILDGDSAKFSEVLEEVAKAGVVKYEEGGAGGGGNENSDVNDNPEAQIHAKAQEFMEKDDKLKYSEAVKKAQIENPELAEAMKKSVLAASGRV